MTALQSIKYGTSQECTPVNQLLGHWKLA